MGIYRTYVRNVELPPAAMQYIEEAVAQARSRAPHLSAASFDFVREVLLLENPPQVLADQREARLNFVMRWQQFTGPIVAKGYEDTALYVYHPLISLNEVGSDPIPSDAASLEEFYAFLENRRQRWPGTLDATTTHDTKRSEDVRARINVLSEIPGEWQQHLEHWAELNARYKDQNGGPAAPDRNEEYFVYQTLLGVWPCNENPDATLLQRVQDHLIKATREAMVHTRWTRPNEAHEKALTEFAAKILAPGNSAFLNDFREFHKRIAYFGMINALSQTLLKITSPGAADFYQGSDLWDLRLVDPDNRGAIDFASREAALKSVATTPLPEIRDQWHDGRIKLYLIRHALRFRRDHADLFHQGDFIPLQTAGCHAKNVVAFLRRTESQIALIAVPRWLTQLTAKDSSTPQNLDWCDTRIVLPTNVSQHWQNVLSNSSVAAQPRDGSPNLPVNEVFQDFPVALLDS
jgi:(1->4)-alpha-D-glucan 1-alpha-D-glucosylmutase